MEGRLTVHRGHACQRSRARGRAGADPDTGHVVFVTDALSAAGTARRHGVQAGSREG
ncbi:hypothetical protein FM125_00555 [Micrococcus lylae]|uniref:Uncharacterized protein n=1 Tax=Micrococcus lylae TaxID=1273 RepID=A0A1R4I7U4_9MICC|nr:hypothetical protein FM125_00555 [Micrococcus lylae]